MRSEGRGNALALGLGYDGQCTRPNPQGHWKKGLARARPVPYTGLHFWRGVVVSSDMRLADHIRVEGIRTDLQPNDKATTLRELAKLATHGDTALDADVIYRVFQERESLATTGVGSGVAIPHGRLAVDDFRIVVAICPDGVPFDSVDGDPAHIFVGVLAPEGRPAGQLKMLARISRVLKDPEVRRRLLAAGSSEAALQILEEEDNRL